MMHTADPERIDAFARLLAEPDPRDLGRRGHVLRYAGDPDRRATRLPKILRGWMQRQMDDAEAAYSADPPSPPPH